jgi:hypothetical protein
MKQTKSRRSKRDGFSIFLERTYANRFAARSFCSRRAALME